MVVALIVSLVIPIGTGFFQAATGGGQVLWAGALINRIYGFAGGPFTLAYYLVMLIPLLLVFFLVERDQDDPIFQIDAPSALRETGEGEGVWQFSRFWLGVLWLLPLRPCADFHPRRVVRLGDFADRARPGAWLAALSTAGLYHSCSRCRRLGDLFVGAQPADGGIRPQQYVLWSHGDLEARLGLDYEQPARLLAGLGMKAFEYYYILLAGPTTEGLYWRRESFLVGNRPHNELLGFTLDVGLIGTVAFIAVLVILVRLAIRVYRRSPDPSLQLVALAFVIGAPGLFVGAMGDNVFSQPSVAVYFWIMAGLVMAIDRHMLPELRRLISRTMRRCRASAALGRIGDDDLFAACRPSQLG